ncbi:hypothetical protein D3C78_1338510 [compost metagenome]
MAAAAQVRDALAPLNEEEANFMVRYQGEIAGLLSGASLSMGVGKDMLDQGLGRSKAACVRLSNCTNACSALMGT